uniref:X2-like carbohydrate binding domain-containing protein n=1 Tax=[Ruminococcus] torques TaxID=33039 RepID=UPI00402A95BB
MYAYQGGLYRSKSLIVGGKEVSGIWRIDAENIEKEAELVLPITDQWQLNSVNVVRGYSQLSYYDGMLYYNTPRAVWRWNFDPESEPEKVFELDQSIPGEIWDAEAANGKIYYETGVYEKGERQKGQYVFDEDYRKAKHPIAVTKPVMTVVMGGENVFLQSAAPGNVTYTSKNPEICDVQVVWKDESCQLIPKKAGETIVTVHADPTDHYAEGAVDVKVIVKERDDNEEHTHNLTLVAAKAATCTTAGNSAYYTCDGCDKWFADATGSVEITDKTSVKIPAPGHTAGTEWKSDDTNHWHECTVAGCGVIIESTKSAHTAGEWIVDTPATATTAGTKHKECTVCHRVLETQPIPSTGTELKIIAGDNQIYNKASGSDVTITCNGDFAKFTGIKVDGSVVDSSNYTAVSGSTVLTLKASYLGTLTDGSHTITFVYTDGEANANLTVRTAGSGHIHDYGTEWKSNADNHWHECNCGDKKDEAAHSFKWVVDKEATATKKGSKHEECKICGYKRSAVEIPATGTSTAPTDTTKPNDTTKPGNTNGSEKSPQTGDNSNIFLWFALLFVSAAGVTGITAYNKKKKEHA